MKYLIFICFLVIIIGCRKPKKKVIDISAEFKSYVCFAQGSYWVYNNKNNTEDSLVLIEAKSSENYSSSISCGGEYFKSVDIYKIQYTFKSKITQINNEYNDAASISDCEGNQFNYLDNLSSRIIFFPPRDLTRFLDSIVIQGVVYNNILESILIDSTLNTEQQVYFAKNIGRIKFLRIENVDTLFDSELKRYHVSPF